MITDKANTTIVLALVYSPDIWGQWGTTGRPLWISMDSLHGVAKALCASGAYTFITAADTAMLSLAEQWPQKRKAVVVLSSLSSPRLSFYLTLGRKNRGFREIWILAALQSWMEVEIDRAVLRQCDLVTFIACHPQEDGEPRVSTAFHSEGEVSMYEEVARIENS